MLACQKAGELKRARNAAFSMFQSPTVFSSMSKYQSIVAPSKRWGKTWTKAVMVINRILVCCSTLLTKEAALSPGDPENLKVLRNQEAEAPWDV